MESIISQVLGMKAKVFTELHEVIIGVSKWDTVTINPASIGIIRGELLQEIGTRQPGDVVLWVAGKSVAAELDEVWRESRGVWTHPVKDFYDNSTNKALRDTGYLGMLCGASVIADDTGIIFHDMLMCVLIRNETLIAATGRFITPYVDDHNDVVIDPTPIIKGKATLTELMDLPDPMIEDNFDICSISAEDSVARSIGTVTAKHPQLMVLIEFQIVLDFGKRAMYEQAGLNLPAYKLETVFHDLDFDQDQLDAREALMSNKLSQLVIRQFKMDGSVARYLVLSDLSPETVNIQHDATSCKVARRKATWSFMTLKESKEFPGAL